MIYLDNGATSFPKPRGMVAAMEDCILHYCGNPGRSGHDMSMKTGEAVYRCRQTLAALFHIEDGGQILFTKNTTEALNLGLFGFLRSGDHVVTSAMEHNSVLRPLQWLRQQGVISLSIAEADKDGMVQAAAIARCLRPETALIAVTAASNVTGTKMPLADISRLARQRGIPLLVDAAQAAGVMDIDVEDLALDMLAFPGHKGLLGPLGAGGLYVRPGLTLSPLLYGGTGTASKSLVQPPDFPEGYEAGTLNAPAIVGLDYAAAYVQRIGPAVIGQYEEQLIARLEEKLGNMEHVRLYGPPPAQKTGITLFNIEDIPAEEVTAQLNSRYGIAVRGGFHCAGLAHKAIGTWDTGAVRVSVGPFNRPADVDALAAAVWEMSKER